METVKIFDTTLRDGEQSPGATLTLPGEAGDRPPPRGDGRRHHRGRVPDQLRRATSSRSSAIAAEIVRQHRLRAGPLRRRRTSSGRARRSSHAARPRIHVFCATSKIHREHKLRKGKEEIIEAGRASRSSRRGSTPPDVEFSPEDASRTELEFLEEIVAGRRRGRGDDDQPARHRRLRHAQDLRRDLLAPAGASCRSCASEAIVLSAHCHDDLGLAVANSLSAVENGARQVECTINGIGERAGNAALEEIVMALRTRGDYYKIGTAHRHRRKIYPASRMVSTLTGLAVQRNKAIVGENAFAHEAGIHQDGMLKYRETYEIMDPATVGIPKTSLVLGKHSGRHAFRDRVDAAGLHADRRADRARRSRKFKALADKKKEVFDEDIEALVDDQLELSGRPVGTGRAAGDWPGSNTIPTATVTLRDSTGETVDRRQRRRRPGRRDLLGHPAADRRQGDPDRLPHPRRQPRQGGPGRSADRAGAQRPKDPRPRAEHRHPRSQRPGLPGRHQPPAEPEQAGEAW